MTQSDPIFSEHCPAFLAFLACPARSTCPVNSSQTAHLAFSAFVQPAQPPALWTSKELFWWEKSGNTPRNDIGFTMCIISLPGCWFQKSKSARVKLFFTILWTFEKYFWWKNLKTPQGRILDSKCCWFHKGKKCEGETILEFYELLRNSFDGKNPKTLPGRPCNIKTLQELRMLSTLTPDCQVTTIVINSGSQL